MNYRATSLKDCDHDLESLRRATIDPKPISYCSARSGGHACADSEPLYAVELRTFGYGASVSESVLLCADGLDVLREQIEAQRRKIVARNRRAASNRAGREDALRSLGLKKVRGALGGTYWE